MLSKSKSEENEECSIFKEAIVIDDHLNDNKGLKASISPNRLLPNGHTTHPVNDQKALNLRTYLDTFDGESGLSPNSRFEGIVHGRLMRSMSVSDINNTNTKKTTDITEFQKYFNKQNVPFQVLNSSTNANKMPCHGTEKEIMFGEINCTLKTDKNELKITEFENDYREEVCDIQLGVYKNTLGQSLSNKQREAARESVSLIKTPPFFKSFSTESQPPINSTMLPGTIQETQEIIGPFDNYSDINSSGWSQLPNNGLNSFKSVGKEFLQTNSLFKNRYLESFSLGRGEKKRSFSEADLTKNSFFMPNIDTKFISDDYYSSLYKKGKLSRSASESCIDPRTFYTKENHDRTIHINKENLPKPTPSYAQIITRAISNSKDGKLSLGEIYKWIEENFEYYKYANPVWKNSIRHNLSLSKCFKKVPREPGSRGKGGKWMLDKEFIYLEESKKKRRPFGDENVIFNNLCEENHETNQNDHLPTIELSTEHSTMHNESKFEGCK